MDDIVFFSDRFELHLSSLRSLFECVKPANVNLKALKCVIGSSKVEFLNYELSSDGVRSQNRLTEAIDNFHRPESRKEVRRFMGLAGFCRHFYGHFRKLN